MKNVKVLILQTFHNIFCRNCELRQSFIEEGSCNVLRTLSSKNRMAKSQHSETKLTYK